MNRCVGQWGRSSIWQVLWESSVSGNQHLFNRVIAGAHAVSCSLTAACGFRVEPAFNPSFNWTKLSCLAALASLHVSLCSISGVQCLCEDSCLSGEVESSSCALRHVHVYVELISSVSQSMISFTYVVSTCGLIQNSTHVFVSRWLSGVTVWCC